MNAVAALATGAALEQCSQSIVRSSADGTLELAFDDVLSSLIAQVSDGAWPIAKSNNSRQGCASIQHLATNQGQIIPASASSLVEQAPYLQITSGDLDKVRDFIYPLLNNQEEMLDQVDSRLVDIAIELLNGISLKAEVKGFKEASEGSLDSYLPDIMDSLPSELRLKIRVLNNEDDGANINRIMALLFYKLFTKVEGDVEAAKGNLKPNTTSASEDASIKLGQVQSGLGIISLPEENELQGKIRDKLLDGQLVDGKPVEAGVETSKLRLMIDSLANSQDVNQDADRPLIALKSGIKSGTNSDIKSSVGSDVKIVGQPDAAGSKPSTTSSNTVLQAAHLESKAQSITNSSMKEKDGSIRSADASINPAQIKTVGKKDSKLLSKDQSNLYQVLAQDEGGNQGTYQAKEANAGSFQLPYGHQLENKPTLIHGASSTSASGMISQSSYSSLLSIDPDHVFKQIVDQFDVLLAEGRTEARIQLRPRRLGELKIHLVLENGMLKASLDVSSPQVKELIEAGLSSLKHSLENQGLQVKEFSVSVGQHRGDQEHRFNHCQHRGSAESNKGVADIVDDVRDPMNLRAAISMTSNISVNYLV